MTVCGQKWLFSPVVNSSSGGFSNRPLGKFLTSRRFEPQTACRKFKSSSSGGFSSTNSLLCKKILNLNFGGIGDFLNFMFQDTLYFGILLMPLVRAGSKTSKLPTSKEEQETHFKPPLGCAWPYIRIFIVLQRLC